MLHPHLGPAHNLDGEVQGKPSPLDVERSSTERRQTNIYTGFAIWTVACGCLSTVTPETPEGLLVFFMLLAGTGAGGVCPFLSSGARRL